MFSAGFRRLAAFLTVYFILSVVAAPLKSESRDLGARATPAAPHFVVYSDQYVPGLTGPPAVSDVTGFNVFLLSFYLTAGPWDKAYEWTELDATDRATIKAQYNDAGIKLMAAAFGSSDVPTTANYDPVTLADSVASYVIEYGLDGVDIDYEDFGAMDEGTAEAWLISFTKQLRTQLPVGDYIVTHAPVAPWFEPNYWPGGGYLYVDQQVGDLIDWYNVQFYNQGSTEYTTCAGLLTASSTTWPNTALLQIIASGVASDKLVIGKPAGTGDATTGYMDPATLAACVAQAKAAGWDAGVMTWEYPTGDSAWIEEVRAQSWPV